MSRLIQSWKQLQKSASTDDDLSGFEPLEFPPNLKSSLRLESLEEPSSAEHLPLTGEQFLTYFDHDGRLINEHHLRQSVFKGGVDPEIRKEVWEFLFELYPFHSTKRERELMSIDYHLKYIEIKKRWMEEIKKERFEEPEDADVVQPPYLAEVPETSFTEMLQKSQLSVDDQQMQCISIQAKVFSGRLSFDIKSLLPFIRIIDKDVPRTDRELQHFSGVKNPNLRILRDILLTYASFNPKLGYTQGMNDIAARFLVVMDNEVEAFWCFSHFMKHIQDNFVEDGLLNKLRHVRRLLEELDPDLYHYLEYLDVVDLTFCHRWMLLNFKREFNLDSGLRCFEIISSHHLELSSMEAQQAREKQKRKDFENQGGKNKLEVPISNSDFTFDVFMCATILIMKRALLFDCKDASDVFQLICGLNAKLNLDEILQMTESLFFKYCKKSVSECFQMID